MSTPALSAVGRPQRSLLLLAAGGAVILILALALSLAREQYKNVLIGAVLAQVFWVAVRWRASFYAFMIFIIIEGFIINYFHTMPELNVLKDLFIGALFTVMAANLVGRGIFPLPRTVWLVPFIAFAVVYVLQVFNPALPNVLVGLVGVRVTLLYFLVVPVAFWFFDSQERVRKFFAFMVWLSVPVSLFGIFQYFVGPQWMMSLSPGFQRAVYYAYGFRPTEATTYFRTFSTFVYSGGFSNYLMLILLLCIAMWSIRAGRKQGVLIAGVFALNFAALLTTGGRAPLVMLAVAALLMIVAQRGTARAIPLLVTGPLLLWGSLFVVGPSFVDRFSTILNMDFVMERNMPLIYGWLRDSMVTDWTGYGAGYASVASRHVGATALNYNVVENTLAKIRFEAGLPGFILYVIFIVVLLLESLRAPARVRDPNIKWLASACGGYLFVHLLMVAMGTPFDTSPTNVYLWLLAGFLAKAPQLSGEPQFRIPQ